MMLTSTSIQDRLSTYLERAAAIEAMFEPWPDAAKLPFHLRQSFRYVTTTIHGTPVLLLLQADAEGPTPTALQKQLRILESKWSGPAIYVCETMSAYQRRRLIDAWIPFIVPGQQLFLPPLGIDLQERFRERTKPIHTVDPSTQVLLLHAIQQGSTTLTLNEATGALGYTKMTMSRAFDAIEALRLGTRGRRGRERVLQFAHTRRDLWNAVRGHLASPVQRSISLIRPPPAQVRTWLAGESALGSQTDLAEPQVETRAVSAGDWSQADTTGLELDDPYPDLPTVELWTYDPSVLSRSTTVDPLSLILSFGSTPPPRVEIALAELEEGLPW